MRLVILGAGGYANTVRDVAEQLNYEIVAMLDDKLSKQPLASFIDYIAPDTSFIPAFGNNEFRLSWCDRIIQADGQLAILIHPSAYVSPKARIGEGVTVLPHAIVNTGTIVNRGCIINIGAIIDHDCVIEDGVHICLGAIVKADNRIPKCMKVEAGNVIKNRTYPLR